MTRKVFTTCVTFFLLGFAPILLKAEETEFNPHMLSACSQHTDGLEQLLWRAEKYGVYISPLVESRNSKFGSRLFRLILSGNHFHKTGQLDRQKYLTLQIMIVKQLAEMHGENEVYDLLIAQIMSEVGMEFDPELALLCAFDCEAGTEQDFSEEFINCIREEI